MSEWQHDWQTFVKAVALEASSGKRGTELSESFQGIEVSWCGRVAEMQLNAKIAPRVRMCMPVVIIPLNGRGLVAEHLSLPVRAQERDTWREIQVGDTIQFSARVKMNGVFSAINIAPDDEQGRDFLEVGVECCRCLQKA
jgi:hypothetical protein